MKHEALLAKKLLPLAPGRAGALSPAKSKVDTSHCVSKGHPQCELPQKGLIQERLLCYLKEQRTEDMCNFSTMLT